MHPPFLHRCGCQLHWLAIQPYAASQLAPTKQQPSFATHQRVSVTTTCTVSICKSVSTPLELLSSELDDSSTALSPTLEASSWLTLYRVNWSSSEISAHASTRQITEPVRHCSSTSPSPMKSKSFHWYRQPGPIAIPAPSASVYRPLNSVRSCTSTVFSSFTIGCNTVAIVFGL